MNLPELCIRRPVMTVLLTVASPCALVIGVPATILLVIGIRYAGEETMRIHKPDHRAHEAGGLFV